MNLLYISDMDAGLIGVVLAIVLAALGGFAIGHLMGNRERKMEETFNPKFRPDGEGVRL
ncbi:hypothetical protein [Spirosoma areae]